MSFDRRQFLKFSGVGLTAGALATLPIPARARQPFSAIVFDGFPIFDPRPVFALSERLFPGQGQSLNNLWRVRQFEYQWLRALGGHYADFLDATEGALVFAATSLQLDLTQDKRETLMNAFRHLDVWPDVPDAIAKLRKAGVRLAILSNMTQPMIDDGLRRAGLAGEFEQAISTDRIQSYKPDPKTYRLATDALGLDASAILFAPFAGWDVAGAKWFGHPTFWVNRLKSPPEELGTRADAMGPDLNALVEFALSG